MFDCPRAQPHFADEDIGEHGFVPGGLGCERKRLAGSFQRGEIDFPISISIGGGGFFFVSQSDSHFRRGLGRTQTGSGWPCCKTI